MQEDLLFASKSGYLFDLPSQEQIEWSFFGLIAGNILKLKSESWIMSSQPSLLLMCLQMQF